MERRRKMTKSLISDSLKSLMQSHPFEKITIKMITDAAGVIRPTFYNYFCDKYEVLEWIFVDEIVDKVQALFDQKMYQEGLKMIFVCIKNDSRFYKRAFEVTGQNSFEDIVSKHLYDLFMSVLERSFIRPRTDNQLVTKSLIAHHYSLMLLNLLRSWVGGELQNFSTDEMVDAYIFLCTHKITDYVSL